MSIVSKSSLAAVVLFVGLLAGWAQAATIDVDIMTFDNAPFDTQEPYVEGAQKLSGLDLYCFNDPAYGIPGQVALGQYSPGTATLTRVDGQPFDFISMGFDEANEAIGPQNQTFTGHKAGGGTVTEVFTTDGAFPTMELFVPTEDFTGLTSLDINIWFCRFDNITSQLPEPATLSLLALGALALIRRRRR